MRVLVLAAALFAATAALAGSKGEMAWQQEIVRANNAWADKRWAILKIDDAVYLKDGQSAYLMRTAAGYKWSTSAPRGLAPVIKYANGKALLRMLGQEGDLDLLTQPDNVWALNERVDLKAQVAQIEPGQDGLRVMAYNQDNPAAKNFAGLEYYPYAPQFIVKAAFEPVASPVAEDFQTSRGWWKRFYKVGEAVFKLQGKEHRLPFYASADKPAEIKEMSAFFMDALTGKETYGVGRYIDVPAEGLAANEITIDFNTAYNPNCARSPHYNCPQAKVTLAAEIRAGERKPRAFPDH
jgi:uncharacterized protein